MEQLPERIGDFEVLGALGRGLDGLVYRARHETTGQLVAIKSIRTASAGSAASLRREVRRMQRLQAPGIAKLVGWGRHDGVPWYAMELVEGSELGVWAQQRWDPATGGDLIALLRPVAALCRTLAWLHGEGVVHGDLKPANILVGLDGAPVLIDFGLASTTLGGELARETLEATTGIEGTTAFMAPERLRGEPVDARADLYSLGAVVHGLLTGRPPFSTVHALLDPNTPAPRLAALVPDVPDGLDSLVARLLRTQARRRPGHALDVAAELTALGVSVEDRPGAPTPRAYLYRPELSGRRDTMEEVLTALRARFEGVERGLVLLVGESGVGKTRVAAEVAQRLGRADFAVLVGEALPSNQQPAALQLFLGPLRAIADLCREGGAELTERLLGARGPLLGLYEPSIADLFAGIEGQIRSRKELFYALGRTLTVLAEERPTALILDDVQFADELSLAALQFLSGPEGPSVMLLGTCRTEDRRPAIDELIGAPGVRPVPLSRLDVGSVGQIVAEMLGLVEAPEGLAESLGRRSEGNPLYVAEYLRGAVEAGLLGRDESGQWDVRPDVSWESLPMPGSLRQLLEGRFEGLTGPQVAVVELAAVFGRSVGVGLLATDDAALATVVLRGLLTEEPPDSLRFAHDRLREVAYDRIPPESRPALHRRVAEALTSTDAPPGETARHWEHAGERMKAREDYARGGHAAAERYAWEQAEALFRRALELSDTPDVVAVRATRELGGRVLHAVGRYEEAEALVRRAWAESEDLGEPGMVALAARALGTILRDRGAGAESLAVVEESLRLAISTGDGALEAIALGNLATLKIDAGDFDGSIELGERALQAHRSSGNRRSEGITLGNLAAAHGRLGRLDRARELLEEALEVHRSIGNRLSEGIALDNLAFVHLEQGRERQALDALAEALAVHREVGNPLMEGHCMRNMGVAWSRLGEDGRARELLQQAIELHRRIEHDPGVRKTLAEIDRLDAQVT